MKRSVACAALALAAASGGCGGGAPLLHPAQTLPKGDVRAAGGVSANIVVGGLANDLNVARDLATRGNADAVKKTEYAKGALVAAAAAPGLAPVVGARLGLGNQFEGGLVYTGRGARVDFRRSFDDGNWSLSIGAGGSATLYGQLGGTELPNVALSELRGLGADVPVLVGWKSDGGLYMFWIGARGGYEHDKLEPLRSEPTSGNDDFQLEADRFYGGGLIGIATGFNHVHVALELSAAYQFIDGKYNHVAAKLDGFTLAPATALWWTF